MKCFWALAMLLSFQAVPTRAQEVAAGDTDRIFGVLPNYTTVERETAARPVTTRDAFRMAALSSFDPYVYPFLGFVAGLGHVEGQEPSWGQTTSGYSKRYAVALAS